MSPEFLSRRILHAEGMAGLPELPGGVRHPYRR